MNISKLLKIFNRIEDTETKELVYDFLIEISKYTDKEREEFLELLEDAREELFYDNRILDTEQPSNEDETRKVYVTQEQLSRIVNVSKRTIQRLIKKAGIVPINPFTKPYYYDFDEFVDFYLKYDKENRNRLLVEHVGKKFEFNKQDLYQIEEFISQFLMATTEEQEYDEAYLHDPKLIELGLNENSIKLKQRGDSNDEKVECFTVPADK